MGSESVSEKLAIRNTSRTVMRSVLLNVVSKPAPPSLTGRTTQGFRFQYSASCSASGVHAFAAHQRAGLAGLGAAVGRLHMRRFSALENCRRRARGTTSESVPAARIGAADPDASPVALRAPSNAPGSGNLFAASIAALGFWLIVIPASLLTDLSGVGAAAHTGTGGTANPTILPQRAARRTTPARGRRTFCVNRCAFPGNPAFMRAPRSRRFAKP